MTRFPVVLFLWFVSGMSVSSGVSGTLRELERHDAVVQRYRALHCAR